MSVLESDLHLDMKDAVIRDLAWDCRYYTEYSFGQRGYNGLRVDVHYTKKKREYLVECETRPNIKRLIDKGKRRNSIQDRTVYILVVPLRWIQKLEWRRLKGYFDLVIPYNVESGVLGRSYDLRFLGSLRDDFLDALMPVYKSQEVYDIYWWVVIRKNFLKWFLRGIVQCSLCRRGVPTPWEFCPKNDCPDSRPWTP